jgi:hypothetical protein
LWKQNKKPKAMTQKQSLKKIFTLGRLHSIQGIYQNTFCDKTQMAQFMAYHNGHNQGTWDKKSK